MYHVNNRETLLPKFIIVFSTVFWLLTETLSGLHALTSNNIRIIWAVIGIICLGSLISSLKRFGIVVKTTSGKIRKYISEITGGGAMVRVYINKCVICTGGRDVLSGIYDCSK